MVSSYRQLTVIFVVVCLQLNEGHPFFGVKATFQAPQAINVNTPNKPNPLADKMRQFTSTMMALIQKKMDEFRIISGNMQTPWPPQAGATAPLVPGLPALQQGATGFATPPGSQVLPNVQQPGAGVQPIATNGQVGLPTAQQGAVGVVPPGSQLLPNIQPGAGVQPIATNGQVGLPTTQQGAVGVMPPATAPVQGVPVITDPQTSFNPLAQTAG